MVKHLITAIVIGLILSFSVFFLDNQKMEEILPAQIAVSLKEEPEVQVSDEDLQKAKELLVIKEEDYLLGSERAPSTLVIFADFPCFSCDKIFQEVLLASVESGEIRVIWRHFLLGETQRASLSLECAGEQGKFWEYALLLFENSSNLEKDNLREYADFLGLSSERFLSCLNSKKYEGKVNEESRLAHLLDISQTPVFFLDGRRLPLQEVIQTVL